MRLPGFAVQFQRDVEQINSATRSVVNKTAGLDERSLLKKLFHPEDHTPAGLSPPPELAVNFYHDELEEYTSIGSKAIQDGKVAYCVMAGGSKSLLRIPELGMSLLTLKLFQGIGTGPIWIVVSPQNKSAVEDHLASQVGIDMRRIKLLEQYVSYRLTPDNQIIFGTEGPELYPCGHGDLFPVLLETGVLKEFISSGGLYVSVVNVDNVFGTLDSAVVGHHISSSSEVTCEVVKRKPDESGGVLVDTAVGLQIVELFRLLGHDTEQYTWLNTNSFVFNAQLDLSSLGSIFHRVQRCVDEKIVVQHERLLQEITEKYKTTYLGVIRSDRFMPIKTTQDLNNVRNMIITD